jgi:ribose 5-phosphate isomerase B
MIVAVACDHAGFPLKNTMIEAINTAGDQALDLGAYDSLPVDYPELAIKIGRALLEGEADRGILLCGSGVGVCIAANKIRGIYAGVCHDTYSAHQAVEHDDMNVLCLGARVIGAELAREIVVTFLRADYIGSRPGEERHARRLAKVRRIEKGEFG